MLFQLIVGAVSAYAAMSTGEEAEEIVEKISGIDEKFIEIHEETSEVFSILLYILGGISLVSIWASCKEKYLS